MRLKNVQIYVRYLSIDENLDCNLPKTNKTNRNVSILILTA